MKQANWDKPRIISVVVDNDSWILPYAAELVNKLNQSGDDAVLCRKHDDIREGMVAFYLGCIRITPEQMLVRNTYNLVVHESDLPAGRGFSPLTWQILEGKNVIPVCLIEAVNDVDAGRVFIKREMRFQGTELIEEMRLALGKLTIDICMEFVSESKPMAGVEQLGDATFYKRRTPADSEMDINRPLIEQFNLLRVVDNEKYPAFFQFNGSLYKLKIERVR